MHCKFYARFLISGRSFTKMRHMARTNRDLSHLHRLRDLYATVGCIPSYSQIAEHLGFKAKNAAFKLIERLVTRGYLMKCTGGRIAPEVAFFALELSDDEVRAGFGAETGSTGLVQAQTLDQLLVARPSKTKFVNVRGDSMVDAGILNGDIAVVETDKQAIHGDFVVAEMDGSITIKELQVVQGRPRLVPHNTTMQAQTPRNTLNVIGVVKGIVRQYRQLPGRRAKLTNWGVTT